MSAFEKYTVEDSIVRVLMIIDSYPPAIGGAQQHVRNLSIELVARGHDVSVATLWNRGMPEFQLDQGVRVYRLRGTIHRAGRMLFSDIHRTYAPPFPDPEVMRGLMRIVSQERPQVVHGHNWLVRSFYPIKAWSGAKLVVSLHGWELTCPKWTFFYQGSPCEENGLAKCLGCAAEYYGPFKGILTAMANRVMSGADRAAVDLFLPVSSAVALGNGLARLHLPFQVVPNFIPNSIGAPGWSAPDIVNQLPKDGYLMFAGALNVIKGVSVLLEAFASLCNAPPLVLIGSTWPDTPTELPPNVIILKNWPHDAVMHAWHRSLVGLVPSIWPEPCPTVAMEAMSCGRPIVASRIGGIPDLVDDGKTGFLVPAGDAKALAERMLELVDNRELRESMGLAAAQKVNDFRASAVVPRFEEVYGSLIHSRS